MKIFLDIGSHYGETLHEVLKEEYNFDKIYCFEPSSNAIKQLEKIAEKDHRVVICPFGLSNKNIEMPLFDPGKLSGSIFSNKISDHEHEIITLRDTAEWFKNNIESGDYLVVKTNCEGSEVDIIDSLINSDLLKNIYILMITFDILEYSDYHHKEREIRKRLKETGLNNFCFSEDVMFGTTHEKRIKNWLSLFGVHESEKNHKSLSVRYKKNFIKYSQKSGNLFFIEAKFKSAFNFKKWPESAKKPLRFLKKHFWTYREQDL